jgi:hypothetical protein
MVLSAELPEGEALIPRIGTRDRDRGSLAAPPSHTTVRAGPYTAGLSGKPAQLARSPHIMSSTVTTPRLNQTHPDLQTAQTLPDLICRTAPQRRAPRQNKNCCRVTPGDRFALTDSIESDSCVQEIIKSAYLHDLYGKSLYGRCLWRRTC